MVTTVLELLGVLLVLFGAAVLATRPGEELAPAHRDAADLALPTGPMAPVDVAGLRFGMALRGYRMAEVDTVLARLSRELAERDAHIAALQPGPASSPAGPDAAPGPTLHG